MQDLYELYLVLHQIFSFTDTCKKRTDDCTDCLKQNDLSNLSSNLSNLSTMIVASIIIVLKLDNINIMKSFVRLIFRANFRKLTLFTIPLEHPTPETNLKKVEMSVKDGFGVLNKQTNKQNIYS